MSGFIDKSKALEITCANCGKDFKEKISRLEGEGGRWAWRPPNRNLGNKGKF